MTAVMDDTTVSAARVTREERTYEEHKRESFFADLVERDFGRQDQRALDRLERHRHECAVEKRVNPNVTAGTGGEFAPPLWAIDKWKAQARAGRVLGDLATNLVLPPGVNSIHIPKTTTGADETIQTASGAVDGSVDQVTADIGANGNVVTISGHVDASLQLFEQTPPPGYDGIVYKDLTLAYNQRLELQMLAGSGAAGQMTGVKNVSGIGSVDGSSVLATSAGTAAANDRSIIGGASNPSLWTLIGQAAAIVGNNRLIPPDAIIMAPRRYYSIAAARDSSQRPLANVGTLPNRTDLPVAGNAPPVDRLMGINTYVSGGIIGTTATNADYIVVARVGDMLLYESQDYWTVNPNPLSGTLQIRLQLHKYVCYINAYASSIAVVTAIPQPTNF